MDGHWNNLEVLDPSTCLALLADHSIGRVGLSIDALPVVLPVNYVVEGGRIMIRSGQGSKLDAALRNAVVCFEVDEIDPRRGTGWSVLVTGVARRLVGEAALMASVLPLHSWSPTAGDHFIAIGIDMISGRRVGQVLAAR